MEATRSCGRGAGLRLGNGIDPDADAVELHDETAQVRDELLGRDVDSVELTSASREIQRRLVESLLARHASAPP